MIPFTTSNQFFGDIANLSSKKQVWIKKNGEALPSLYGFIIDYASKFMGGTSYECDSRTFLVLVLSIKACIMELNKLEATRSLVSKNPLGVFVPKMCVTSNQMVRKLIEDDPTPRLIKEGDYIAIQMKDGSPELMVGQFGLFKNVRDENSNEKQTEADVKSNNPKVPSKNYYLKCGDFEILNPPKFNSKELEEFKTISKLESYQSNQMTLNWNGLLKATTDTIKKNKLYELLESPNRVVVPLHIPAQNFIYRGANGMFLGLSSLIEYGVTEFQEPGYPSIIINSLQNVEVEVKDKVETVIKTPSFNIGIMFNEQGLYPSKKYEDGEDPEPTIRRASMSAKIPAFVEITKANSSPTIKYSGFYNRLYITDEDDWRRFAPMIHPPTLLYGYVNSAPNPVPKSNYVEHSVILGSSVVYDCHIIGGMYVWLQNYAMKVDGDFIAFDVMHILNDIFFANEFKKTKGGDVATLIKNLWASKLKDEEPALELRTAYNKTTYARNPLNINKEGTMWNWKETTLLVKSLATLPNCENVILWSPESEPTAQLFESLMDLIFIKGKTPIEIMRMSHPNVITDQNTTFFFTRTFVRLIHYATMAGFAEELFPGKMKVIMSMYAKMMDDAINADAKKFLNEDDFGWDTARTKDDWFYFAKCSVFVPFGYLVETTLQQRIDARLRAEARAEERKRKNVSFEDDEIAMKKKKEDLQAELEKEGLSNSPDFATSDPAYDNPELKDDSQ